MTNPRVIYLDEAAFRHDALHWAWALGAVYNVYHGFPVDLPVDPALAAARFRASLESAKTYLPRDWGIEDRGALVAELIRLGRGGHRRGHRALVRRLCALPSQAWAQYEAADIQRSEFGDRDAHQRLWRMWAVDTNFMQCRSASLLAFDAARAAQLARSGYALGYLDETEMRGYLFDLAREVSATFASWETYAHDFLLGRAFWAGESELDQWEPIIRHLGSATDSPWTRLPFAFPEDDVSRSVISSEDRGAPYWTLESAPITAPAPIG